MIGTTLRNRWVLEKKIGQGAFGDIYAARDIETKKNVAVKMEECTKKRESLKLEVVVLKSIQDSPYAPIYISCGRIPNYNYVVMELLGNNLAQLKRKMPTGKFSLGTTLRLGIELISAIEDVHEAGFLHRDIKPSNFALRRTSHKGQSFCCVIDFGLARKYVDSNFQIRPARQNIGFRGTARYASIASHQSEELGRKDDLWSLYYLLIEFLVGQLPWRKLKEKDEIKEMKIKYNCPALCQGLPPEFVKFFEHINSLKYEDKPNYQYLRNLLRETYLRYHFDDNYPFDWEIPSENIQTPILISNSTVANTGMSSVLPTRSPFLAEMDLNSPKLNREFISTENMNSNLFLNSAFKPIHQNNQNPDQNINNPLSRSQQKLMLAYDPTSPRNADLFEQQLKRIQHQGKSNTVNSAEIEMDNLQNQNANQNANQNSVIHFPDNQSSHRKCCEIM
ncbi:tau-tubulin kinase 1 [Anaeramoeba ignava]|uniref:Tau-tubulin kinase 1 n=1 Tax=Anaeramoeba ignava TaxID=1746090 RepID=A0A9Q0LM91_ANAIG|nr:tau-tubulin kinase 1 [Anaeramoeba ignava]